MSACYNVITPPFSIDAWSFNYNMIISVIESVTCSIVCAFILLGIAQFSKVESRCQQSSESVQAFTFSDSESA